MTSGPGAQAAFAATLVDEWFRAGVRHAVIAPGSRSTPLTLALAADGRLRLHVVLDERSAGFVALGLGLASGWPAVVVTTSGTAAVELHPAVVEAHHAGVALIAVTADRPAELQGVGAPQTVDQAGLFGTAVGWAAGPGVADTAAAASWRSLACRAVWESLAGVDGAGPVHLNVAFREPLVGEPDALPPGRPDGVPWHVLERAEAGLPPAAVVERLAAGGRGLIVAGGGAGDPDAVHRMAEILGWPVLADPRSGCRIPSALTVGAADALLRCSSVAGWRPEVVLRLGRPWASKILNGWLAGLAPEVDQVLVDPVGAWPDPDRGATLVVAADPTGLCSAVAVAAAAGPGVAVPGVAAGGTGVGDGGAPGRGLTGAGLAGRGLAGATKGWAWRWALAEEAAQGAIDQVLAAHSELTEPGVARTLAAALPDDAHLFCSSSMPVRDVEWYARPRYGPRVLSNRGANGIDGVVSTAIGVALADPGRPTVALMGDLAFLYDAGALVGSTRRGISLTLVVVDNNGGGIFSFLPQVAAVSSEVFEQYWGTPHRLDLAEVASAYGVAVEQVTRAVDLAPAVGRCMEAGGVRMVLVRTERGANVAIHDEIHAAVAGAVADLG